MISAREPVYPLFLALFRLVFREGYLFAVIIFQAMLAGFSAWLISERIAKSCCTGKYTVYGFYAVHAGVALICQFLSERGAVYSNSILTEGIALSLWLIYMYLVFRVVEDCDLYSLLGALILAAVMTDIRKQLAVSWIALMMSVFFGRLGRDDKKSWFRRLYITLALCIVSIFAALMGTRIYNSVLRGDFAANTRDMNLVLTTSLYVADREDADLIEEERVRELFLQTMDRLEESGSNIRFAGDSLRELEEHYEEHYDMITIDTTKDLFVEYAVGQGMQEGFEAEQEADRYSKVIVKSLIKDNLPKYIRIYAANFLNGCVNTVAKRNSLLDIYAVAIIAVYLVLMGSCLAKGMSAGRFGLCVLMAILANTGVTAALIFCQTRYMIYNMPLFYMAGLSMLDALITGRAKKR
ncbi:MAG: hypothetical protein IKI75_11775 [Lachnospiraceae bacterium]|nr:hypothetical protein [Lachnospiraceae bacterium]